MNLLPVLRNSFQLWAALKIYSEIQMWCRSELSHLHSFEERLQCLSLTLSILRRDAWRVQGGMNQAFYQSALKGSQTKAIARDLKRDLGIEGYEIWHDGIVSITLILLTPQCED